MKIIEFGDDGKPIDRSRIKSIEFSALNPRRASRSNAPSEIRRESSDIQLYMFQTRSLRTKLKYIKMNEGEQDYEIPVPWFLIKHPRGNVVIDGGNAVKARSTPGALGLRARRLRSCHGPSRQLC
jgi:N-acyl homoserine lactone hydrolase